MLPEAGPICMLQSDPGMMRGLGTVAGLTPLWSVKNQARMHRRNADRPYGCASSTLEADDRVAP